MESEPKDPKQAQRSQFVSDLAKMLASEPWTQEEVEKLYRAISNRVVHKTCNVCGKLKPQMDGMMYFPDGNVNQSRRFMCRECAYS